MVRPHPSSPGDSPHAAWGIARGGGWCTWAPLFLLLILAFGLRGLLPAWVWMWTLCAALFAGCKWITLRLAPRVPLRRALGYLFLWPGMEAGRFLLGNQATAPPVSEWVAAGAKTVLGITLFFCAVRFPDLAAGWLAMAGLVLAFHCGLFHLLSACWRAVGIEAPPLMNAPLLAENPAEFWSERWNRGFSDLCRLLVLRPLRRMPRVALMGVFMLSGFVHELVISLPARGGYGLPTAYFLIQGTVLALGRSPRTQAAGLNRGWRGRALAWVVIAGPAYFLFHPPFVYNVVLPMLEAVGMR